MLPSQLLPEFRVDPRHTSGHEGRDHDLSIRVRFDDAGRPHGLDSGVPSILHTGGMSSCCEGAPADRVNGTMRCPESQTAGRAVDAITVKALLTESALARLSALHHYFCEEPACVVVYFDTAGAVYRRRDVRVPVWQKESYGTRMICYCFGETEGTIRHEIQTAGVSLAVTRVREHIKSGRCACDVRNSRGTCCLGELTAAVDAVRQLEAGR
jgi:hypothetical protein